ncbi:hypothetical protein CGL56_12785 [Neolewinella marina]|uniref:Uncharacterized protein n=1 Tax=Neolewinella marina TaxID=438751 RepID=A0A2G0CDJ8_9BACT|nr:hypothetical protein CGL56_12785 [Neolewinella marina]
MKFSFLFRLWEQLLGAGITPETVASATSSSCMPAHAATTLGLLESLTIQLFVAQKKLEHRS